jgi:hypothetical protein
MIRKQLLTLHWTPKRLLFLAAACTYLLLALLPASQWLIRYQSKPGFYAESEPGLFACLGRPDDDNPIPPDLVAQRQVKLWRQQNLTEAAKYPNDYRLQFAAALQSNPAQRIGDNTDSRDKAKRLWQLRTRFPNEPSLYASVLRCLTRAGVNTGRDPEQETLPEHGVAVPEDKVWFAEVAAAGETLDPHNAYFPMMRAVTYFAAHQDAEGLAALHRASQKIIWDDYWTEEIEAVEVLRESTHGETGTLARFLHRNEIGYPQLNGCRAATNIAISLAVRKELAGDTGGGWKIRRDVLHCGAQMRNQSHSLTGSWVGTRITENAMSRPGGEEVPKSVTWKKEAQWKENHFRAYANTIGQAKEGAIFLSERAAVQEIREISRSSQDHTVSQLSVLTALWAAGPALISLVVVVLVLGGMAFGLAQTSPIQAGLPLPSAARWGVLVLVMPLPLAVATLFFINDEGTLIGYAMGFLVSVAIAVGRLYRGSDRRRNILTFAASLTTVTAICGVIVSGTVPVYRMLLGDGAFLGLINFSPLVSESVMIWVAVAIFGGAVFHALWIASLAVISRCRRVSVSAGIVRGIANSALPIASVLLFSYVALSLVTLQVERQSLADLKEIAQHEGRYYARLAGKPWPGENFGR